MTTQPRPRSSVVNLLVSHSAECESASVQDGRLYPTLWRTCRVMANATRIKLLAEVIAEPQRSVEDIAAASGVPARRASAHLRLLQSRGLLTATRQSRWVLYEAIPDPLVLSAAPLLAALRAAVSGRETTREVKRALTAFTHPRRLRIVKALTQTSLSFGELLVATGISRQALCRHMDKLRRRGVVQRTPEGRWQLGSPVGLTMDLQRLVASG